MECKCELLFSESDHDDIVDKMLKALMGKGDAYGEYFSSSHTIRIYLDRNYRRKRFAKEFTDTVAHEFLHYAIDKSYRGEAGIDGEHWAIRKMLRGLKDGTGGG